MFVKNNCSGSHIFLYNKFIKFDQFLWHKINLRILMIAKHIYCSSKKNDTMHVSYLQHYLINCIEAKVFFINKILCYCLSVCGNLSKTKIILNNINNLNLLNYFTYFHYTRCKLRLFIVEHALRYIMSITVRPVWKARLSINFTTFMRKKNLVLENKSSKHLLTQIFVKKFCCSTYLKYLIFYLFLNNKSVKRDQYDTQILSDIVGSFQSLKVIICDIESFDNLCTYLTLNDISWSIFHGVKNKKYLQNLNYKSLKHIDYSIALLNCRIFRFLTRQILYRISFNGLKKINSFSISYQTVSNINLLYCSYYSSVPTLTTVALQQNYNLLINLYLKTWMKKNRDNKFMVIKHFEYLKQTNKLLNKLNYVLNLTNIYSNLIISRCIFW